MMMIMNVMMIIILIKIKMLTMMTKMMTITVMKMIIKKTQLSDDALHLYCHIVMFRQYDMYKIVVEKI